MITQKQRDEYRYALEDKGVPEVLAYMAAQNVSYIKPNDTNNAADMLRFRFTWLHTKEGHDFWSAVCKEAEEVCE